ncbi:MAG: hypothetical protein FWF53_11835 [Candidatus Azobacteroides sp.]|nr:hypothetical protein [Candidatus Azobacteroides sp.]
MAKSENTLSRSALVKAIIASVLLIILVFLGSGNFRELDAALIPYLLGVILAVFGITYRLSVWLQRPPTRLYWKRMGKLSLAHPIKFIQLLFRNLIFQKFIYSRGKDRWIGHFLMSIGCIAAFGVTIPLTFGWIGFVLKSGSLTGYEAHMFGFKAMSFQLGSFIAYMLFHVLIFCSIAVIIGAMIMLRRRMTEEGLVATQTFEGDLLPLLLIIAVAATGLGIAFDYMFLDGKVHQFMSVTHAVTVILFLLWIPFGKFIHIVQRPMQIGVNIYKMEGEKQGMAVCPLTKEEFATKMHIADLKEVTLETGFDFRLKNGDNHLNYSPEGKRSLLAKAHLKAREDAGSYFG